MTNLLLLGFLPSGSEWIIIALVILLLFGGKKIPELMRGLGKGVKSFKDGVTKTKVLVHATIEHVDKNGDVQLSFYLSSKAECEGAQEVIDLRTEVKEEK